MNKVVINKVVINTTFGGFGLSDLALNALAARKGVNMDDLDEYALPRHDADLVAVVEEMGSQSWGPSARLSVASVAGNRYRIKEYDGLESIETPKSIEWTKID